MCHYGTRVVPITVQNHGYYKLAKSRCRSHITTYFIATMNTTESVLMLIAVSMLWGFTNPLMKRASIGIESVKCTNAILQFLGEFKFLIFNWKYVFPFLINQSGSALYYWSLGSVDLTMAVIFTNSLTFIFTTIAGQLLGEKVANKLTYIGMIMVMAGVTLCVLEKTKSGTSP